MDLPAAEDDDDRDFGVDVDLTVVFSLPPTPSLKNSEIFKKYILPWQISALAQARDHFLNSLNEPLPASF